MRASSCAISIRTGSGKCSRHSCSPVRSCIGHSCRYGDGKIGPDRMTILLSNLRLKLLALFFAVALWSVVAYTSNPTQSKNYQLTIHPTVPSGLVIVGDVSPINVTVIGTADNLGTFDKRSLRVTANLSNVKLGRTRVPIEVQNSDSSVNVVAPSSVQVTIDELASSNQTVVIQRGTALPTGFHEQVSATTITQATEQEEGPKSHMTGIQAAILMDL